MVLPDPTDVAACHEPPMAPAEASSSPMQVRIELRDYDPVWPQLYAREATRIRSALGERVVRLEHVGSTSVPGLAAKPIIDIVLEVPDAADETVYLPAIQAAGYVGAAPGARLVPAPAVEGPRHRHQPACVLGGLPPRPTGCCGFGTGSAATPATASCMRG